MLPRHGFMRCVRVVLLAYRASLLLGVRVPVAGVLALVRRQRRRPRRGRTVPAVPAAVPVLPAPAPVLTPARRRIAGPTAKIRGSTAVVLHRHAQHEQRDVLGLEHAPRAVVPIARVPAVPFVHPVQAVVEEVIRTRARVVVDRIARNRHQVRVNRHVDADLHARNADANADLGVCRHGRREQQQYRGDCVAHG